ncbi:DnaJ-domain-containing protein [Serendipita vermifera]|nr:DnaJ-domain-containing protein [Serendipita vermifera]
MASETSDPYELLGISSEARVEDINKAFRQKSLKVHPDRNPDNPEAAAKFHELKQAQELLLDPQRRAEVDASLKKQRARAEQLAKSGVNRKRMIDALAEAECAHKKQRTETVAEARKREEKETQLKDAGRRMREEKEKELAKAEEERVNAMTARQKEEKASTFTGIEDTPVVLKYQLSDRPDLMTKEALLAVLKSFGPIDESTVLLTLKPKKLKPGATPKSATAVITFHKVQDAFGAVMSSRQATRGLQGVEVAWPTGEEPESIKTLREKGLLETSARATPTASPKPPPSEPTKETPSVPKPKATTSAADFEAITLMRLRQADANRRAKQEAAKQEAKKDEQMQT